MMPVSWFIQILTQVGDGAVKEHQRHPGLPDQVPHLQPKLHRVGAGIARRR